MLAKWPTCLSWPKYCHKFMQLDKSNKASLLHKEFKIDVIIIKSCETDKLYHCQIK